MRTAHWLFIVTMGLPLSAAADTVKPRPAPAYKLAVPYATPEGSVKLACPAGTQQLGGSGSRSLDGAVHCVKVPIPKGAIPVKHGPAVRYADGKMSEQGEFVDHNRSGVWVAWNDDGKIKSIVTYRDNEYDGLYVTYWDNGTPQSEIEWKAGKRNGLSKTWGDDGKPLSVIKYEMDRVVSRTDYGPDGKPIR